MGFISCMTNSINFVLTPATPTNTLFKVLLNQHKKAPRDENLSIPECTEGVDKKNAGRYNSKTESNRTE